MDQQEFVPGLQHQQSQGKQPMNEDEINYPARPYYWSTKPNTPKDEPASHYDEPMVQSDDQSNYQSGYIAHDNVTPGQQSETIHTVHQPSQTAQSQRMEYSPDGDAFENQYRPNNANANYQQWSPPPWARPQVHRWRPARLIWFIILAIIFIGPLLRLLGALIIGIGVLVLAILVPFLLVALVALPFAIFSIRRGRGPFRSRPGRWRYTNYWRGPWGW